MKIINLVRSEFIKNYCIKRFVIIVLLMVVCSFCLIKYIDNSLEDGIYDPSHSIHSFERVIENLNKEENTLENEYELFFAKNYIKYMTIIKDMKLTSYKDWKIEVVNDYLIPTIMQNFLIEKIKEEVDREEIGLACEIDGAYLDKNSKSLKGLCGNFDNIDLDDLYNKNIIKIKDYEKMLDDDKYYLFLKYQVTNKLIENNEFIEILIDKKVVSNLDFLGLNYLQYNQLEKNATMEIDVNNFEENDYYNSPEEYVAYNKKLKDNAIKYREILLYSTEYEIKHDLSYNFMDNVYSDTTYINSKNFVNQIFHFSIIVIIIVAISNSGIISKEHNNGTIKNIITAPVRRWKILLSKFIYLIMDTYFIWFIGLFVLSIIVGLKYGFSDLFTPKLIYLDSNVIEVNYYLYLIKNMLIASIPVICFLSILFFLSTLTLNTSLTVGITTGLGIITLFVWLLQLSRHFRYIVYTPLWYFDSGFILNNSELFINSLSKVVYDYEMGIIISIFFSIVLYIIGNIFYIKRDIKS